MTISATRRAHTTKFIVEGVDYFTALTDEPGVRIGMVGGTTYDIPAGHAYFNRVVEAWNENVVEEYFDELTSALA